MTQVDNKRKLIWNEIKLNELEFYLALGYLVPLQKDINLLMRRSTNTSLLKILERGG